MKKINLILRKCKSFSRQLGRSSSYSSLRSKSTREELWVDHINQQQEEHKIIFVGSTRKRYVISSKHLSHPLVDALLEKSNQIHKQQQQQQKKKEGGEEEILTVKCEVVLFDHLLWMLENADPNFNTMDSFQELADLYVF